MNIISCYKLLLILITPAIHFSEQIKHINESSSIDACKGKDVDLLLKVNGEKNNISKLVWYFNNKTICTSSPVDAFTVKPPYHGRIERIGTTEIRLKNVSQDDEGIYILFPLFRWSTTEIMPKIELHVLEPPTNKCTCNIGYPPDFKLELTASYCGRPQVSLVWKRKQTFEVLGKGNHTLDSTLQDKEVLCCQVGEAMTCVDDNRQTEFCTTVSIPHRDNERPSEDGNTQRTDSVTMPGTDTGSTNIQHIQPFVLVTMTVCLLTALLVLVPLICKIRKKNKCVGKMRKNKKDSGEESVPMLEENCEKHERVIKDGKQESVPMLAENCEKHERVIKDGKQESVSMLAENCEKHERLIKDGKQESVSMLAENCEKHERLIKDGKQESVSMLAENCEKHERLIKDGKQESVSMLAENCEKHERVIKDGKQESVSMLAENCEKHERLIKDGKRPRHVITSEDYEHQHSLFLENMKEMLKLLELHQAALCKIYHVGPRHVITSEDYEHQHSLFLEKMKEMLELHQAALCKIHHVGPRHVITSEDYEHQHSLFLEKMKEMLELQQAAFCKICHDDEMSYGFYAL